MQNATSSCTSTWFVSEVGQSRRGSYPQTRAGLKKTCRSELFSWRRSCPRCYFLPWSRCNSLISHLLLQNFLLKWKQRPTFISLRVMSCKSGACWCWVLPRDSDWFSRLEPLSRRGRKWTRGLGAKLRSLLALQPKENKKWTKSQKHFSPWLRGKCRFLKPLDENYSVMVLKAAALNCWIYLTGFTWPPASEGLVLVLFFSLSSTWKSRRLSFSSVFTTHADCFGIIINFKLKMQHFSSKIILLWVIRSI